MCYNRQSQWRIATLVHTNVGETDVEFGLFKKYFGKGYAAEASHLALQCRFRRLGLDSVLA